jgi:hypothetical protein
VILLEAGWIDTYSSDRQIQGVTRRETNLSVVAFSLNCFPYAAANAEGSKRAKL